MRERLGRELLTHDDVRRALVRGQLIEQAAIVARIDDHRDGCVILGRRTHHRRPADVDVLDGILIAAIGPRDGRCKRV